MSTQSIADYVTKQIFIENNVVTYRSLSRHLGLHVNAAKNELATYHHNAPYHSQTCVATFLLSGTPKRNTRNDEDYAMDSTQSTHSDGYDGDEVPQTSFKIVNEKDLEDTKYTFEEIHSIHVYSLSPVPLLDAGLLCTPTEAVRNTDKSKGTEYVTKMGHIIGEGIKVSTCVGVGKKRIQPPAPVAGPSKVIETKPVVKSEEKERPKAAPEKPKATGKLNFFKQPEKPKDTKEAKKIKQEEPAPETSKRMFFSKPPAKTPANEPTKPPSPKAPSSKVPSPAPSTSTMDSGAEKPARGVKRKSSVGLEKREKSPEARINPAKVVEGNTRRRKVVLSDDDEDSVPVKAAPRKKRISYKTDSAENSAAEGDAHLLMDIDDDEVEKVSRVPSTNASSNEFDNENDFNDNASISAMEEDVQMEDVTKPKVVRKRKPKAVIPVGRNGLKKVKVTKTRRTKDKNGYVVTEDYSDWQSVASGTETEAPVDIKEKAKAKPKPVVVKKEAEIQDLPVPAEVEKDAPLKKAPSKSTASKPKAGAKAGGAKTQKGLMMNFFGPKKTT